MAEAGAWGKAMKCELLLVQNEVERTERMGTMRWRSLFVARFWVAVKTAARTLETQLKSSSEGSRKAAITGNWEPDAVLRA